MQAVRQESARRAAMYACRDGSSERVPVLWRDDVTGHVTAGARFQGLSVSLCVCVCVGDGPPSGIFHLNQCSRKRKMSRFFYFEIILKNP